MSITHSLKLMLLLSDEAQVVHQHNEEIRAASAQTSQYKEQVIGLLDDLLSGESPIPSNGV